MAILNVTPDSFSDGGNWSLPEAAIRRARACLDEGADLIDVGGESTRPGAVSVSLEEELTRILPVVRALVTEPGVVVSVDTSKPEVAEAALAAGAHLINDVTGLRQPRMREVVARHGAAAIAMHMQGSPGTMQSDPRYSEVVGEVHAFLFEQARLAREAGIERVMLDPGIGFGKTLVHNLALLRALGSLRDAGYPVLLGASRKRFIGDLLGLPVSERLEGSLAAVAHGVQEGVDVVRVHDVRETVRLVRVLDAIVRGGKAEV
jgi:dihydropteroate synthase